MRAVIMSQCVPVKPLTVSTEQKAYNQAKLSHCTGDWYVYYNSKKECQQECRRAYNNYVSNLVDSKW